MGSKLETLCRISKVTDDDCGMYRIGEIEGAFSPEELEDYLKRYGEYGESQLLGKLAFLQWQVWNAVHKINAEKEWSEDCKKYYEKPLKDAFGDGFELF